MNNPLPVFEELQKILGPLPFSKHESGEVFPKVQAKIQELRDWGVSEQLLDLIDESTQIMLRMKPGDECAAIAYVMSEIEDWKLQNPIWLKKE